MFGLKIHRGMTLDMGSANFSQIDDGLVYWLGLREEVIARRSSLQTTYVTECPVPKPSAVLVTSEWDTELPVVVGRLAARQWSVKEVEGR